MNLVIIESSVTWVKLSNSHLLFIQMGIMLKNVLTTLYNANLKEKKKKSLDSKYCNLYLKTKNVNNQVLCNI